MKLSNPRAQLRRDLNAGKVQQQPRTEDEKDVARAAQLGEAITAALTDTDWEVHSFERDDRVLTFTFAHTEKRLQHVDAISRRVAERGLAVWIVNLKRSLAELEAERAEKES